MGVATLKRHRNRNKTMSSNIEPKEEIVEVKEEVKKKKSRKKA